MKSKMFIVLGGMLLVIAAVSLVLLLMPRGLESYKDMIEKQDYAQARAALEDVLQNNPDWHEARALLVEVELNSKQPLAALSQIAVLRRAGWNTDELDERLLEMLLTPKDGADCIDLLQALNQSVWTREFAVRIALQVNSPDLARRTLLPLYELQQPQALIAKAWRLISEDDFVEAWKIADILGNEYKDSMLEKLTQALSKAELDKILPILIETDQDFPGHIILKAGELGGYNGLELLLSLENTGWQPGDAYRHYPGAKLSLVMDAELVQADAAVLKHISWDTIESRIMTKMNEDDHEEIRKSLQLLIAMEAGGFKPENQESFPALKLSLLKKEYPLHVTPSFFTEITRRELYPLAQKWVDYTLWDKDSFPPETAGALLTYLAEDPDFVSRAAFLKLLSDPPPKPEPERIFYSEKRRDQGQLRHWEVSPDRRHVLYSGWDDSMTYWYDLELEKHIWEYDQPLYGVWDSARNRVALIPRDEEKNILIFNTDTAAKVAEFAWTESTILGWQDGCLLVAHLQGSDYQVEALDPVTTTRKLVATTPVLPSLSDCGQLGYITWDDRSLQVFLGDNLSVYTGNWAQQTWKFHGWMPDDRGLVLKTDTEYGLLEFQSGRFTQLVLDQFHPHPGGWLDSNRIAGINEDGIKSVMILDIRDMSWTHTGLTWHQNGRLAGACVYRFWNGNLEMFPLR